MPTYAQGTTVPISKSKQEIEELLTKRKAKNFAAGSKDGTAIIAFELDKRHIRICFPLPDIDAPEFAVTVRYRKEAPSSPELKAKLHEAECRRRWRAVLLIVRAKLEAIESKIGTLESEFLANIVVPGGKTFGEFVGPQLQAAYERGVSMPPLLGGGT